MNSENQNSLDALPTDDKPSSSRGLLGKLVVASLIVALIIVFFVFREYISLGFLVEKETQLKEFYVANPLFVYAIAFLLYVVVTGLSLPGALPLSLTYAWFFGFLPATILVSFASTTGATFAFMLSRYLLRDWIQSKFSRRLKTVNEAFEREGAFYLLTARLIPLIPFWLINLVMGLTKIRLTTFWIVSQVGMLAGTMVYVYAGSRVPSLQTIHEEGVGAVFNSSQLLQLTIAFTLLGLFPIIAKKSVDWFRKQKLANDDEPN